LPTSNEEYLESIDRIIAPEWCDPPKCPYHGVDMVEHLREDHPQYVDHDRVWYQCPIKRCASNQNWKMPCRVEYKGDPGRELTLEMLNELTKAMEEK